MALKGDLEEYYSARAAEYEKIYHRDDPSAQIELDRITRNLQEATHHGNVLEVACGTGFWTQAISTQANSIVALDASNEVLQIAKSKQYKCPTTFCRADAYAIPFQTRSFDCGLACFWISHIKRQNLNTFLDQFHKHVASRAIMFFVDNVYVPGLGGEFVARENEEDTYKVRMLQNGSKHLVLKNYFTEQELARIFKQFSGNPDSVEVFYGDRYWYVKYESVF